MSASAEDHPTTIAAWRVLLRFFGIIVVLAVFSHWYAAGQNPGWTKDQVPVTQTDEITGIDYVTYEKRFVPGVDLLVLGTAFGLGLSAITFIHRKSKSA